MKSILVYIFIPEMVLFLVLIRVKVVYTRYLKRLDHFSEMECGHFRSFSFGRVVGGNETEPGEFPWITSIQSKDGQHFCAGFMVNSRFLVSAAHCFSQLYNDHITYQTSGAVILESVKVFVSHVQLSDSSDTSKLIDVRNLIMHPKFEERKLNNDIELQQDMEWSDELRPICLPAHQHDIENGNVTVAGWGYRQCDSFTASNELMKITVPLWTADDCKKSYEDADYHFPRHDYVCAGSDGKDVLNGDSGGPMMILNSEKRWTAVGIVSSGKFMCSDKVPGIYTKVSSYVNWIKSQIE